MGEGQALDIRSPLHDLTPQLTTDMGQRFGLRIEIDEDEPAELLDRQRVKANLSHVEIL